MARIIELLLGGLDTRQGARLNKCLSRLGNYRFTGFTLPGRNYQCHGPANTVPEQREPGDTKCTP
jgi:hypothetical protein